MKFDKTHGLKLFFERLLVMVCVLLVQSGMAYQQELLALIEAGDAENLRLLIKEKKVRLSKTIDLNDLYLRQLDLSKHSEGDDGAIAAANVILLKRMQDKVMWIRYGNPLVLASAYGHSDVVQMLLEEGSKPDGGADLFFSPLYAAAAFGHLNVVRQLIQAGASPLKCSGGETPLHIAAKSGHTNIARELLSFSPESINNTRCSNNTTPADVSPYEHC